MTQSSATKLRWEQRVVVTIAPWLIRLLSMTWRFNAFNEGAWKTLRAQKKSFIFSLWHGHLLTLMCRHRGEGVFVLISEHRDGEMIAQVARKFGMKTIRGSTTRGAARALLEMVRTLEEGHELAITPDGPRGPAYTVAPGVMIVSQRAQRPIIAIGVHANRAWRMKSWDAFMIPKPFAKISIVYGDPLFVEAADAREAAEQTDQLAFAMNAAVAEAQIAETYPGSEVPP